MEAVLCSKKRTDDYLWVINEVYVQTLCHDGDTVMRTVSALKGAKGILTVTSK